MNIITCNALLGYGTVIDPTATALGFLAKLYAWYDFEDDLLDSWGCWPLVLEVTGTYDDASSYGSGVTGRCILGSKAKCQDNFPEWGSSTDFFLGALRSESTFGAGQYTANLRTDSTEEALSLSESATGYRASIANGITLYDADVAGTVDTWTLSAAQRLASGAINHSQDASFNAATNAGNATINPTGYIGLGNPGGSTLSIPALAYLFVGKEQLTSDEMVYLYNGGTPKTLADVITDSGISIPSCTMTDTYPFGSQFDVGYLGQFIGHSSNTGTNQGALSSTTRSSGKYWATLEVHHTLDGLQGTNLYLINGAATSYGGNRLDILAGNAFSVGAFTVVNNPGNAVATAGDIIMIAADLTNGKVWFGLNGTWYGDPVAGTGEALTISGSPALHIAVDSASLLFSGRMAMTASDMPYTDPTGYTPWGD